MMLCVVVIVFFCCFCFCVWCCGMMIFVVLGGE